MKFSLLYFRTSVRDALHSGVPWEEVSRNQRVNGSHYKKKCCFEYPKNSVEEEGDKSPGSAKRDSLVKCVPHAYWVYYKPELKPLFGSKNLL